MLEKIAANSKGTLRLAKLNVEKHPEARRCGESRPEPTAFVCLHTAVWRCMVACMQIAEGLQVKSLPTVFSVVNGQIKDQFTGLLPPEQLQKYIERTLGFAAGAPQQAEANPSSLAPTLDAGREACEGARP